MMKIHLHQNLLNFTLRVGIRVVNDVFDDNRCFHNVNLSFVLDRVDLIL